MVGTIMLELLFTWLVGFLCPAVLLLVCATSYTRVPRGEEEEEKDEEK